MSDLFYLLVEQRYKGEKRPVDVVSATENLHESASYFQRIQESQFTPKAFPERPSVSAKPIISFEELEKLLENL